MGIVVCDINIGMIILYWLVWKNDNGNALILPDFVLELNDMINDIIKELSLLT